MQSLYSPRWLLVVVALSWTIVGCGDTYSTGNSNNENLNNIAGCDGGGCIGDKALGEACIAGAECASGYCPAGDGVCCHAACEGECEACVEAKTGLGDGTCGPISANTDPDTECPDEGATSCGANGTGCNGDTGVTGCNLYDDTTVCADGACAAGTSTEVSYCDGSGVCDVGGTASCAPYACDSAGTGCLTGCTGHGDCDAGSYCDGNGDCVPKETDGTACTDDDACVSGFCTDGVCCDRICDATCESCSASATGGSDGVCGAITVDTDPDTECTDTGPASCGADGTGCNGDGANPGCNVYNNTTVCSPASCTNGILTDLVWCDGAGTCGAAAPTPCAPYLCDASGTACSTSCVSHLDCASSSYCDGTGTCVPTLVDGATCAIGLQCQSGFCPAMDGVCCDTACDSTCESCLASKSGGTDGVCSSVIADSDPDTECSAAAPSTCGAAGTGCNGNATTPGCNLYDNTTVCATAGCTGGVQGGDGTCDGAGLCVQGNSTPCAPYVCNSAGTVCLTTCAAQNDCMSGYYCDGGGVCQPKLGDGVACAVGFQCASGSCPAADGVCCDTACGGTCEACLAAKTGGTDGVCGAVQTGLDPDNECGADVCNGTGSCRCTDGVQNGAETDVDCGGGTCPGCGPGLTCGAGSDCASGNCPAGDNVCCNLPCGSTCEACVNAKTGVADGTCSPVTGGTDPDNDCSGADVCNGFGLCRCTDGQLNGVETDVDCGGGVCATCGDGQICAAGSDCTNGNCPADDNVCCDTSCNSLCESCLGAVTGGTNGSCDWVLTDTDPDNECGRSESCDGAGTCYDPCPTVGCFADADCTPGATGDLCVDGPNDCLRATCVGATPGNQVESGAPITADFTSWQSGDAETDRGGGLWYCNATLPVTANGVLTNWELYVDSHGANGEASQLMVIRCTTGGGGSGPVLSVCSRVGIGPAQTITGNGLNTDTLAGSTQLDSATPDPSGIVVQTGDIICADVQEFELGVDCNGTPIGGGCPGAPDFDTQYQTNIDTRGQPFALLNSSRNGVLMIKAYGSTPAVPGTCSDNTHEPDTINCSTGGGDTCCSGLCVVGPGGQGNCN